MYEMATREKHSFWYVNLRRLPAEFYINFDEQMLVDKKPDDDEPPDDFLEPPPKRAREDDGGDLPHPDEA